MKLRQKIYDSSEQTNKLIKITNSYHLFKNLEKIKNRKPIYINNSDFLLKREPKQRSHVDLKDYYKRREDEIFGKVLGTIKAKKVYPMTNTEQSRIINNTKESRLLHKMLEKETIEKDNEKFKRRLFNQKPFISAKSMDKEYKRLSNMEKKRKYNASRKLILPPIKKY